MIFMRAGGVAATLRVVERHVAHGSSSHVCATTEDEGCADCATADAAGGSGAGSIARTMQSMVPKSGLDVGQTLVW